MNYGVSYKGRVLNCQHYIKITDTEGVTHHLPSGSFRIRSSGKYQGGTVFLTNEKTEIWVSKEIYEYLVGKIME